MYIHLYVIYSAGHSASLVGENIVFFGGVKGRTFLNEVVVLNTSNWRWSRPEIAGPAPDATCYHSATVVGTKVIIVGGNTPKKCLNKIYVLDTSEGEISILSC